MRKAIVALSFLLALGFMSLGTAFADPGTPPVLNKNSTPVENSEE